MTGSFTGPTLCPYSVEENDSVTLDNSVTGKVLL